jgi:hypothetical protein
VYGQFAEHLGHIIYSGLWAEHLYGRKFEVPFVHRVRHGLAAPWEPVGASGGTTYLRAPEPLGRFAVPQDDAHHAQAVVVAAEHEPGSRGIGQSEISIDAGVRYRFRARVRHTGAVVPLVVRLCGSRGRRVLAEARVEMPSITATRFGDNPDLNQLWMDDLSFAEVSCDLAPKEGADDGWLVLSFEPPVGEAATVWFDWVSLLPTHSPDGWHRDVVEHLAKLPVRLLKWPGGCMADAYDWRLGIGPRDKRHCAVDQAWAAWEENDVGTDELIALCRMTGAEPVIGVNAGSGDPELAAAWVEYCNGSPERGWGARRAANGHPEPYGVRYWVVGNEQWGWYERGNAEAESYATRYLAFAAAMRAVDPTIRLAAVGRCGAFNRTVLRLAAPAIDLLQIHHYVDGPKGSREDVAAAAEKVAGAASFDELFAQLRADLDAVPGAGHIRICLDEWGWGRAGHAGAMFLAGALNAIHRAGPFVEVAARAAVINVDGLLERDGESLRRTSAYEVFRAFNAFHHPASVRASCSRPEIIDVSALAEADASQWSTFLVNRSTISAKITLEDPPADGLTVLQLVAASHRPDDDTVSRNWSVGPRRPVRFEAPPLSLTCVGTAPSVGRTPHDRFGRGQRRPEASPRLD